MVLSYSMVATGAFWDSCWWLRVEVTPLARATSASTRSQIDGLIFSEALFSFSLAAVFKARHLSARRLSRAFCAAFKADTKSRIAPLACSTSPVALLDQFQARALDQRV